MGKIVGYVVRTGNATYGMFAEAEQLVAWLGVHWRNVKGPIEIVPVMDPLPMPGPIDEGDYNRVEGVNWLR